MVLMPIGTLIYGFLYQRGIYFPVNLFSAIIIIVTVVLTLNTFTITKSAEEYNGWNWCASGEIPFRNSLIPASSRFNDPKKVYHRLNTFYHRRPAFHHLLNTFYHRSKRFYHHLPTLWVCTSIQFTKNAHSRVQAGIFITEGVSSFISVSIWWKMIRIIIGQLEVSWAVLSLAGCNIIIEFPQWISLATNGPKFVQRLWNGQCLWNRSLPQLLHPLEPVLSKLILNTSPLRYLIQDSRGRTGRNLSVYRLGNYFHFHLNAFQNDDFEFFSTASTEFTSFFSTGKSISFVSFCNGVAAFIDMAFPEGVVLLPGISCR